MGKTHLKYPTTNNGPLVWDRLMEFEGDGVPAIQHPSDELLGIAGACAALAININSILIIEWTRNWMSRTQHFSGNKSLAYTSIIIHILASVMIEIESDPRSAKRHARRDHEWLEGDTALMACITEIKRRSTISPEAPLSAVTPAKPDSNHVVTTVPEPTQQYKQGATVYLAAVLEYLVAELVQLAGSAARDNKTSLTRRIIPCHLQLAIRNEEYGFHCFLSSNNPE
ncbi:hypothetical protein C8J56DRAFT_1167204 [Mycena floridula]|nr:hypothetical protein C8J56DRAFT_1167204 [Mycena floridula]